MYLAIIKLNDVSSQERHDNLHDAVAFLESAKNAEPDTDIALFEMTEMPLQLERTVKVTLT